MLRIPNVDREDEGRYVCSDDNGRLQHVKLVIAGKYLIYVLAIDHRLKCLKFDLLKRVI